MTKAADILAWREAENLTQEEAAKAVNVASRTWRRWENGDSPIPGDVAERMRAASIETFVPAPVATQPKAAAPELKAEVSVAPYKPATMAQCLARKPLYAETSAEARAMREQLAGPEGRVSLVPMIPLKPRWVRVGGVPVNAAIPDPVGMADEKRFGPNAVLTKDGRLFDMETAHEMRAAWFR